MAKYKSGIPYKTGDPKEFKKFEDELIKEVKDLENSVPEKDDRSKDPYEGKKDEDPVTRKKLKDPEPAKGIEQLKEKELTNQDLDDLIRQALAENPPSYMQLNHLVFQIPPEQITIQHEIKNIAMGVLRAGTTQKTRTGHGFIQVSFPLVFTSRTAVNDELVPLLYMLRKTPFCWVHNEFLRKVLMPENTTDAMMLTLQSVTVQSVPNLPTTFQAVLQLLWFNYKPYTKALQYRKFYNLDERMEPIAFGPEAFGSDLEKVLSDVAGPFIDSDLYGYQERNRFKEHLDTIRAEPDPDKQRRLYDYLQEYVANPGQSLPWYEFIRGAEQNILNGDDEYGPSISPDKYFRMAWKEWGSPGKTTIDKTWKLEDENYQIYSKLHSFSSDTNFLPVHVSVQFAHRIASLPLLSHQLPTHQYLGPTDREITITFHVTKAGKRILERFQKEIELFEQNVIDYRTLAHNAWMEITTPLAKASHFPIGEFGYKVVPEHIDIETIPGAPAASMARVTFSEFNPSVYQEDESPLDREEKVIRAFVQGVFNKLSGGKPTDVLYAYTNIVADDLALLTVGAPDLSQRLSDSPSIELRISMTKNQAYLKGMSTLWECAQELVTTTQYPEGNPVAFSYADDEETYGLKSLAEMSLYWDGEVLDTEDAGVAARDLKSKIKEVALKWLRGRLGPAFPSLAIELENVNLDLNSCYPDMDLPPHPVTGRVIDTEPDFYLVDQELVGEADRNAEVFAKEDILPAVKRIVESNAQTDVDLEAESVDIVEKEEEIYSQKGVVNMDGLPDIDPKKYDVSGDLVPQNVNRIDKLSSNITAESVLQAGIDSMRRDTRLGMKKAYPTFRLYFIKEGRDQVTYSSFYEAQGGFAVKDLHVVRSRNIPADTCVITMVNLDGFIETNVINDIRQDEFHAKQARYVADNDLLDKHEQVIKNQLQIHNSAHGSAIKYNTIRNIIDQVNENPPSGGSGPMGVTNIHAEIADGKTYSSSTLKEPVTNIRIGTSVICQYAAEMAQYRNQARFEEIVASMYRFPKYKEEIASAAEENYNKNGLITFEWANPIRSTVLNDYVETFRPQGSSESFTRRQQYDNDIEKLEENVESRQRQLDAERRRPTSPERRSNIINLQVGIEKDNDTLKDLKTKREATAVRQIESDSIIFKEGTDVVLKMGYSNNPENLEITFVGEVTEVQPGPGTLTMVAQSFATELMQDIKGVPNMDVILKDDDTYAAQVSNWILSYPEVKHFGRWEDAWEMREDERNVRGVWYKSWYWSNNPSDDNVYLGDEKVGEFTLNGRTLWQGLQDLCFIFPGFVMGVRPYRDLDRDGRRRWRNTLFIGKPDTEYLWWVPDDWNELLSEVNELKSDVYYRGGLDVGADVVSFDTNTNQLQKDLDNLNAKKKWLAAIRREPFRRYHFLSSYHNIIDNGIVLTKRDTYNGIRLNGMRRKTGLFGGEKDEYEDVVKRQLDGMDEENINWLYVENDNAWDKRAQKMATSMLLWQLRDVYQGEITILGDPGIRPYDVCYLNDLYNDIYGPVEVGQVVHTFSEETGFITQIKPDLFTSIGELAQRSAMGAMGAYSYRWLLNRMGISWYDEANSGITYAYRRANETVRTVTAFTGITALVSLTAIYPLFMGPLLVGGYFLGNYIKNHATIRVVPLMHKGYPFVTGLEGFKAPDSSNVLLNQFRLLRRGISEGVDAVSDLFRDSLNPRRRAVIFRRMFGL